MGMRQRLGVAACLLGNPELLILDEPMNGLDPAGMRDMREMILSLVEEGRTVVLSSHLLDEVERTCDAVAIVDRGRSSARARSPSCWPGPRSWCRWNAPIPSGPATCCDGVVRRRRQTVPEGLGTTLPPGPVVTPSPRSAGSSSRTGRPLPAAARPGLPRIVVPRGHEPTGGGR